MLPIDDLTNVLSQVVKQLELPMSQVDILTPFGDCVGLGMNRQITDFDIGILLLDRKSVV